MTTSFRVLPDPFAVYFDLTGNLAAGGVLHFYEAGTTTDADVYGDPDLSVNNGATIDIGTDGRTVHDVWGDGTKSYRCRIYDVDGTLVSDRDNLAIPGAGGLAIPSLDSGAFLTNNGALLLWEAIRQIPDPTGSANKVLSTDGDNFIWIAKPSDGSSGSNAAVTVASGKVSIGDGSTTQDLYLVQSGSGTISANGSQSAQLAVTFPTGFKTCMFAVATPTATNASVLGPPAMSTINKSASGFTAVATISAHGGGSDSDNHITNDVPFDWFAVGTIAP